jgi:hypothetical protein
MRHDLFFRGAGRVPDAPASLRAAFLAVSLTASGGACAPPPQPGDALLAQLEPAGFLKHAGAGTDALRAEIRAKGFPAILSASGRIFIADSGALSKGGILRFIETVRPFLEKEGVVIPKITESFSTKEYRLTLMPATGTPETITIWAARELEAELSDRPGITAGFAAAKTVALLNKVLQASPSKERAYGLHSGGAFSVMFLTAELHGIIRGDPKGYAVMTPYTPTLDYPSFGQMM